jgi:cytochrome b561
MATFMTWLLHRSTRLKKAKPLTYEELSKEREFLYFGFVFFASWCVITASKIDWLFFGYFTVPLIAAFLVIVLLVARWVFRQIDRPKPAERGLPDSSGPV